MATHPHDLEIPELSEEALALLADEAEDVAHALSDDELDYLPLLPDDTHTLADRVQAFGGLVRRRSAGLWFGVWSYSSR